MNSIKKYKQSPSIKANSGSASQAIPHLLWNPKFIAVLSEARHRSPAFAR